MCWRTTADSNFVIPDALRILLTRFRRDASGQDLIEYALLAAMIVLAVVFSLNTLSAANQGRYTTVASQVESGNAAPSGGSGGGTGSSSATALGSASGASASPPPASDGSSSPGSGNSGNNGNHAGGGNNRNGRGNGGT